MLKIVLLKPLKNKNVGTQLDVKEFKKNSYGHVLITNLGESIELPSDFDESYYKPVPYIRHDMEDSPKTKGYQLRKPEDEKDEEFDV